MAKEMNGQDIMYGQYKVPPPEEMVKFGVGQPSTDLLPLDLVGKGMDYTRNITNPSMLQYGDIPGYSNFRKDLAEYLSKSYEHRVDKDELFVTNGNTDAVAFFCSLFTPGKEVIVYVEEPTYFLALNIFKDDFKLRTESIPIRNDGIDMGELEKRLKDSREAHPNALRVLYTVPTFHNPTSYTMSHEKRLRLADLAKSNDNFIILADEVYQLLYFSESNKPSLPLCYYTDKAISMGSFSKILAPSLRLGWMQIKNKYIMNKFLGCGQMDSSGGKSPFVQSVVHGVIMSGGLDANIHNCRNFLGENCRELSNLVRSKLSDYVDFIEPSGGYFLWLKLKHPFKASELVKHAAEKSIQFIPGTRFSAYGDCDDYIRLSFSYYNPEGFTIGIDRMVELFEDVSKMCSLNKKYLIGQPDVNVGVLGYNGKLGKRIVELMSNKSVQLGRDYTNENLKNASVIIDVSSADGLTSLLKKLLDSNICVPLVIGTTGDLPMDLIKEYSKYVSVALISNFSEGVPQVIDMIKSVDENAWNVSITESHHVHKKDMPSGTAKTFASAFTKDVNISSIREGEVIGIHSINFDRDMESIRVTHKATDRNLFAEGAIRYANWILTQPHGLYTSMRPKKLKFSKYSGCGNDFIIITKSEIPKEYCTKDLIEMCKRGKSVGADGVILVEPSDKYIEWIYYNSDGSNVEMCGNGARCVVQYCLDSGYKKFGDNFSLVNNFNIETKVIFTKDTFYVQMPKAQFQDFEKSIKGQWSWKPDTLITVGVPHFIHMNDDDTDVRNPNYRGKQMKEMTGIDANSNEYSVNTETNQIHIRTYERGVYDETLACGTGCCAVAVYENNLTGKEDFELVTMSGDIIKVKIMYALTDNATDVIPMLSGPAKLVFSATC